MDDVADFRHEPVLLGEALTLLNLRPGAFVVDGTLGGGGHLARSGGERGRRPAASQQPG